MDLIQELKNAIINGDEGDAVRIAKDIIENKIDVQQAITDGIVAGMKIVGKKYEQREYFIPEIIISTDTFNATFEIFKPYLTKTQSDFKATVVIGVVKGDIHEIGKNIVAQFLSLSGYNIVDLGRNVHSDDFIKAVEKYRANVVCLSTLMSPTLEEMKIIVKKLNEKDLRNQVKVMIGGAPTDYEFMKQIGADFCCKDANEAVEVLDKYFAI